MDETKGAWDKREIDNQMRTIHKWIKAWPHPPEQTHCILEATGTYGLKLAYALSAHGFKVSMLNPKQASHFIRSLNLSNTDDDACAKALCIMGQAMGEKLPLYTVPSEQMQEAEELRMGLRAFKKDEQATKNRIHALKQRPKRRQASKMLKVLKKHLKYIQTQVKELEKQLYDFTKEHFEQVNKLAQTITGIGPATASVVITTTNGFKGIQHPKQLVKFFGIEPRKHRSGSSVFKPDKMSKCGDPMARQYLYMAALSARQHNPDCKALFTRLRAKGKPYNVAMVAVMNKLCRQLFAVVKSNNPFDKKYHLKYLKT